MACNKYSIFDLQKGKEHWIRELNRKPSTGIDVYYSNGTKKIEFRQWQVHTLTRSLTHTHSWHRTAMNGPIRCTRKEYFFFYFLKWSYTTKITNSRCNHIGLDFVSSQRSSWIVNSNPQPWRQMACQTRVTLSPVESCQIMTTCQWSIYGNPVEAVLGTVSF